MILAIGCAWIVFGAVLFGLCLRASGFPSPRAHGPWVGGMLAAVVLVVLLFRPDEEVESGEDAGAYFNAALSFAQAQHWAFTDPGLAVVSEANRALFRYGHPRFQITKDAVLWRDAETSAEIRAHFFPAFSILLAVPAALGFPYAAFWVSPILALLIGVLLAILGYWLTGRRWAGWLTFALYIGNPVIVWNARCLRAEWLASFLVLSGLVLWFAQVAMDRRLRPWTGVLAGLALSSATLVHITALYVLLPVLALALWLSRNDRYGWAWWCGIVVGLALFVAQLVWVTDPYWMLDQLAAPSRRAMLMAALLLAPVVAAVLRGTVRRWVQRRTTRPARGIGVAWTGAALGLLYLAVVFYSLRFRSEQGQLPGLPAWTAAYLSLTDFEGVQRMMSRALCGFALLGIPLLGLRASPAGRLGRYLLITLGPASLTIGWVFNYLFETRRMLPFLIPLLVLSAVVLMYAAGEGMAKTLARFLPSRTRWTRALQWAVPVFLTLCGLGLGVRGRGHLFTTWNQSGTFAFYESIADRLAASGDFLLGEYTQVTAPLERLTGLPTLPLAWGYRSEQEYRATEQVWAELVRNQPDTRFVFVSPFAGTALPGLCVEPLFTETLHSERLGRARHAVPDGPHPFTRTLHASRVYAPSQEGPPFPYSRTMDGSRLGFSGYANWMPRRSLTLHGIPLHPEARSIDSNAWPRPDEPGAWVLVFAKPESGVSGARGHPAITVHPDAGIRRTNLAPEWEALVIPAEDEPGRVVRTLTADGPAYWTDLFWISSSGTIEKWPLPEDERSSFDLLHMDTQWTKDQWALALPLDDRPRQVWIWATSGREASAEKQPQVTMQRNQVGAPSRSFDVQPGWQWYLLPLDTVDTPVTAWHRFDAQPAWNPGLSAFPTNLGLRIHRVVVE